MLFNHFSSYPTFQVFLGFIVAAALTMVIMPAWIKLLKRTHVGQQVRADVDRAHPHPLQREGQHHGLAAVARHQDGPDPARPQRAGDERQGLLPVAHEGSHPGRLPAPARPRAAEPRRPATLAPCRPP